MSGCRIGYTARVHIIQSDGVRGRAVNMITRVQTSRCSRTGHRCAVIRYRKQAADAITDQSNISGIGQSIAIRN